MSMDDTIHESVERAFVLPIQRPRAQGIKGVLHFLLHLAAAYALAIVISPLLTGIIYRHFRSILHAQATPESQFYFSNILVAAVLPALLAGYLNSKYRHTAALWVWTVPALILLFKLLTFPSSTVLDSRWSEALAYYFSPNWSVPRSAQDAFSRDHFGMRVFIAQADFSAPFYSGIGYSLGTCAGIRRLVRRLCQFAGNAR